MIFKQYSFKRQSGSNNSLHYELLLPYSKENTDKALAFFKEAEEKGNKESSFHVKCLAKSYSNKMRFLEEEAKIGNIEAQYLLGKQLRAIRKNSVLLNGMNDDAAKEWFEKAANKGHIPAQFELGYLYYTHRKRERDNEKAFIWLNKAATAGYPLAQIKLADFYICGWAVKKDLKEAFDLYYKAALKGYDEAMYEVGQRYHKGIGVEQDLNKAIEWYKKSNYLYAEWALKDIGIK